MNTARGTCTIALALFTLFLTVILVGIPTIILAVPVLGNSSGRLEFTPPGSVNRSCSGAPQGPRLAKMQLLFEPTTIPSHCHAQLESDLLLRPLAADDDARGHLELLSVLTVAPNLADGKYRETFDLLRACPTTYFTIVIVQKSTDKVVACGTIFVERKFVRSAGLVGHIEDIAVSKTMQGRKLGLKIINTLEEIGRGQGCYKIILDCSKDNIPFYEKCGFKHKEFQMVRYMADPGPSRSPTSSRL